MDSIAKNELKSKFEEFLRTWSSYKDVNDKKLENLESKLVSASNEAEIKKLNSMLNEQSIQLEKMKVAQNRPCKKNEIDDNLEFKSLDNYIRGYASNNRFAAKASEPFQVHSESYGGAFCSSLVGKKMIKEMETISVFRKVCNVESTSSSEVEIIIDTNNFSGLSSKWSLERLSAGSLIPDDAFSIDSHVINIYENYVYPMATTKFLEDAEIDVISWLLDKAANAFAKEENRCFLLGSGSGQPKGIMAHDFIDYPEREQGKITRLYSGIDGEISTEALLSLIYSIEEHYSDDCSFMMHPRMMEKIRSLKYTGSDNYIWQPALSINSQETVLGIPAYFNYNMSIPLNVDYPIMFGNFKRSCFIVDRSDIKIIKDPFSHKPLVSFYITKRIGFSVVDTLPLFLMKLNTPEE